jgi:hypothetical protein
MKVPPSEHPSFSSFATTTERVVPIGQGLRSDAKYNARWTMTYCVVASLALHASLTLPVVLLLYDLSKARKTETQLVELYG